MIRLWHQFAVVAITLSPSPVTAARVDPNAEVTQIVRSMVGAAHAVTCQLRTPEWNKSVAQGYFVESESPCPPSPASM